MKAIILAAWEGSRLRPLTNTIPKPMIKIFWKPIIEHNLEHIYKYVKEIIIVVKYKAEIIENYFGNNFKWVPVTYHLQNDEKWTWAAIKWIKSDFDVIILNWDSIFNKNDLKEILEYKWYWALVKQVPNPEIYGIFKVDNKNNVREIIEKPETFVWNLANLWVYKFNSIILDIVENITISKRWEYEITDAINEFANRYPLKAIEVKKEFIDVWYPWDIIKANSFFLDKLKESEIKWKIEDWVVIKWKIILESGAIIKSGTYIEWNAYIWKNSEIWPNAHLRWNVVIWDNSCIGHTEVKEVSIWDNTKAKHFWYIWSSVIWNNVNIAAWFISMDRRHDNSNIKVMVKWKLIDSALRKLWCVIWDNVRTWVNTLVYPWRMIENDAFTMPWEIIK